VRLWRPPPFAAGTAGAAADNKPFKFDVILDIDGVVVPPLCCRAGIII